MNKNMFEILISLAILAGGIFGGRKLARKHYEKKISKIPNLDVNFIKSWISERDMAEYNKSYTVVMLRGKDLPRYNYFKLFLDTDKMVVLCLFDKLNNKVVYKDYFNVENLSKEFGNETFIEFPFEM